MRQQVGSLRGVVKPHAIRRLPSLGQVLYRRELVAELIAALVHRGSAALELPAVALEPIKIGVRADIPELIHLRDGGSDSHGGH